MAASSRVSRTAVAWLLGLAACLTSGCVGMGGLNPLESSRYKETPCQLGVRWQHDVAYAPDPAHNGQMTPGLVCRIHLYGREVGTPLEGDGALHVELSDASVTPPRKLEEWNYDAATLKKFQRNDFVGTGYSVFLPWGTYREDLKKVELKVAYQAKNAAPLYAQPSTLLLGQSGFGPLAGR